MRTIGVLILLGLLECLLGFALFMPTPAPGDLVLATTILGSIAGPMPPLTEQTLQQFGFVVALPLTILACCLIGRE